MHFRSERVERLPKIRPVLLQRRIDHLRHLLGHVAGRGLDQLHHVTQLQLDGAVAHRVVGHEARRRGGGLGGIRQRKHACAITLHQDAAGHLDLRVVATHAHGEAVRAHLAEQGREHRLEEAHLRTTHPGHALHRTGQQHAPEIGAAHLLERRLQVGILGDARTGLALQHAQHLLQVLLEASEQESRAVAHVPDRLDMLEGAALLEEAAATRTRTARTAVLADLGLGLLGLHGDRGRLVAADLHRTHATRLGLLVLGDHGLEDRSHPVGALGPVAVEQEVRLVAVELLVVRREQREAHGLGHAPRVLGHAEFAQTLLGLGAGPLELVLHQLLHRLAAPPGVHRRGMPAIA